MALPYVWEVWVDIQVQQVPRENASPPCYESREEAEEFRKWLENREGNGRA